MHQRRPPLEPVSSQPASSQTPPSNGLTSHSFQRDNLPKNINAAAPPGSSSNSAVDPVTPSKKEDIQAKAEIMKRMEGKDPKVACPKLKKKYDVVPGSSWGSLPVRLQK